MGKLIQGHEFEYAVLNGNDEIVMTSNNAETVKKYADVRNVERARRLLRPLVPVVIEVSRRVTVIR